MSSIKSETSRHFCQDQGPPPRASASTPLCGEARETNGAAESSGESGCCGLRLGSYVGTPLCLQHSCCGGGRLVVSLGWERAGRPPPACPYPSPCVSGGHGSGRQHGGVQDGSRGESCPGRPGPSIIWGGAGCAWVCGVVAGSEGDAREREEEIWRCWSSEERERSRACQSVSQTVLAVAIQCGPYCVWVRLGGQGVLRVSVWGGCISVSLRGLYICASLPGVMTLCVCVCVCSSQPMLMGVYVSACAWWVCVCVHVYLYAPVYQSEEAVLCVSACLWWPNVCCTSL